MPAFWVLSMPALRLLPEYSQNQHKGYDVTHSDELQNGRHIAMFDDK
jgi:hypothetical protein